MDTLLERRVRDEVALVGSFSMPVSFAFTERSGGVSKPPYTSLNLGAHVGDDLDAVYENRRRVLRAFNAFDYIDNLLVPNQIHSDKVSIVSSSDKTYILKKRQEIAIGTDAIVCTVPHVPIMLCFADCVPVVLVTSKGFAVVHSGWRGTFNRISSKAAHILLEQTHQNPSDLSVYIGPHILGDEYEVSPELIEKFSARFGIIKSADNRLLDLSACIIESLVDMGVSTCSIHDAHLSTMRLNSRFFSYRCENGMTGRHAAIAIMR